MAQDIFSSEWNANLDGSAFGSGRLGASDTPQLDALLHRGRCSPRNSRHSLESNGVANIVHSSETFGSIGFSYGASRRELTEMEIFVYMVDDDVLLGRSIQKMLVGRGIHVRVESDPFKALEYLCSSVELDVILMDLIMPGMAGSKLFEELRIRAPDRCARTVFLTGYADMGPKWLQTSGCLTLEKPVSPERILRVVEEYAKLDASRGPGGESNKDMPTKPSHPELPALYDEEAEVTTGILSLADSIPGITKEARQQLQIRYLVRKVAEHEDVIGDLKSLLKYAKYSWAIAIALASLFEGVQQLLKHIVFK